MRLSKATIVLAILAWVLALLAQVEPAEAGATLLDTGLVETFSPINGAQCWAVNIGTTPVRVNSMKFVGVDGNEITSASANCHFPGDIFPGLACVMLSQSTGAGIVLRCSIAVATSTGAKSVRGTMQVYDTAAHVYQNVEAR